MGSFLSTTTAPYSLPTTPISTDSVPLHHPSEGDLLFVRTLLLHQFPLELADMILDLAMYWPRIVAHKSQYLVVQAVSGSNNDANFVYLVTPPISSRHVEGSDVDDNRRPAKVHMVRFSVSSHDQGWGGELNLQGPYHGSYTWFEAGICRCITDDSYLEQADVSDMLWESQESQDRLRAAGGTQVVNPTNGKRTWLVQRNVRASSEVREHTIMWTNTDMEPQSEEDGETGRGWGTGFVRSLVGGDRIVLLIRALYPGWANYVLAGQVEVFYTI